MLKALRVAFVVCVLTLLTQVGGVLWLVSRVLVRDWLLRISVFALFYATLMLSLPHLTDRHPVSGIGDGPLASTHPLYPILLRNYVTPELGDVARDLANEMERQFPGTQTATLDGGFPFFEAFPLLPHLSHDDGEKLDLALYWADSDGAYLPGKSKSVIGYWGFADGPTECPAQLLDLRWDMTWLQGLLPERKLDEARTRAALRWLANDARVQKILIEPHLADRLGINHPKVRFQGCKAARHDDHIHIQL
jgi:hypothetical protein